MENILEIKNLNKTYKTFALQDVNLKVPKGCIMGFIGENGAGKSTTIKAILELIQRDSGEIVLFGNQVLSDEKEIKEHIGVVMDQSVFPEEIKTRELGKIMKSSYRTWDVGAYESYMEKFQIPDKKIKELSRGMKMKLSIAVALSHDSKLLILDEATSGLDPIVREEILDIFLDFIQDEQHSIFISSHILSDLEKICDYITFIHKGRIVLSEEKDFLLEQYRIVKGRKDEIQKIKADYIVSKRESQFGVEALVKVEAMKEESTLQFEKPSLEEIMLFTVKGEN